MREDKQCKRDTGVPSQAAGLTYLSKKEEDPRDDPQSQDFSQSTADEDIEELLGRQEVEDGCEKTKDSLAAR